MPKPIELCDAYLWQDISILPKAFFRVREEGLCYSELVNTTFAWYFMALLVGSGLMAIYGSIYPFALVVLITTAFLIPTFFAMGKVVECDKKEEEKVAQAKKATEAFEDILQPAPVTAPTARNPFMNVLLDEIKYNPTRPPAGDISALDTKQTLDDFFRVQFTSDPTDVFGRSQSQRQFIAMPSTTVPNDADSYQNWLYRIPGKTCKEGGREACLPGTDGGALPWLNVER